MSKNLNNVHGACLCGAVKFTLSGVAESFHLCHCSRCRKATGTAHASNIFWGSRAEWYEDGRDSKKFEEYPEF